MIARGLLAFAEPRTPGMWDEVSSRLGLRGCVTNLNGGGAGPEWVLPLGVPAAGDKARNLRVVSPAGSY